jgi:type IV pilus assembly protein PilW
MRAIKSGSLRGFSMIELMVAMLIGLIGMVIIFQVFEVSEGIKRTTTSGGDAQQNGAVALYLIEHDLRNAGAGFNDTPTAGCQVIGFDSKRATPNFPTAPDTILLVPARITSTGAATSPDQLTIFYGSKPNVVNATTLQAPGMPAPAADLNVRNPYGYRPGDLILLQDPGTATPCAVMEVTKSPASLPPPTAPINVERGTNPYTLLSGVSRIPRFNPVGGLGVTYTGTAAKATLVFNLGNIHEPAGSPDVPVHNTYAIANRSLQVTSLFVPNAATASPMVSTVADNIVHMRALYGIDTGPVFNAAGEGDGVVDTFVDAATFNAMVVNGATPPWRYLIAVRVALVARSALAERPSEGAAGCDATTDGTEVPPAPDRRPKWTGPGLVVPPPAQVPFNLTADPDWKCYRYRTFETTVPLRNWIWRSS